MGGIPEEWARLIGEIDERTKRILETLNKVEGRLNCLATKEELAEVKKEQEKFITKGEFVRYTGLIVAFLGALVASIKSLFSK